MTNNELILDILIGGILLEVVKYLVVKICAKVDSLNKTWLDSD
ncbi:hypothetical protein [Myxosarcina sp. GI1(2024)]